MLYKRQGGVDAEQKEPYWIWGIVTTMACIIMVVVSTLYFRRMSCEIFLIVHIILAVFVIARKWGYEFWLYAACGVWFFDRVIRVGRILKNGMRKAEITKITEDIVRIDVKDVRWQAVPGRHTYAYFPTLNPLRPWENHTFSIVLTSLLQSQRHSIANSCLSPRSQRSSSDVEKSGAFEKTGTTAAVTVPKTHVGSTTGISLYVRKSTSLTKALNRHASLLTLLDGPYPNNSTAGVPKTDRLVLIAGGIGITAVIPFVAHHPNVKLYWSVKSSSQGLVNDLNVVLQGMREKEVTIGSRLDVSTILEHEEAEGWKRTGVVVCGPGGLCDDVRTLVSKRGRFGGAVWELDVEAFS